MPYTPAGPGNGTAPAAVNKYAGLSIQQLEAILETPVTDIADVAGNWQKLADDLRDKIIGQDVNYGASGTDPLAGYTPKNGQDARAQLSKLSSNDKSSFDGILRTLQSWQGPAADEFILKALQVRAFGMSIVHTFCKMAGGPGSGSPNDRTFNGTLTAMADILAKAQHKWSPPHDGTADPNQVTGLHQGRARISQNIMDLLDFKQVWNGWWSPSPGAYTLLDKTTMYITSNASGFTFVHQPDRYYVNTPYWTCGDVDTKNGTVTWYRDPPGPTDPPTTGWLNKPTREDIANFYAADYQRQLSDLLLDDVSGHYVAGKSQLPDVPPASNVATNGSPAGPNGNSGSLGSSVPGFGSLPPGAGPFSPGGGSVGPDGSLGPGAFTPGSLDSGAFAPGNQNLVSGSGPGSNVGGLDPTQLAGFNPGGGLAPGATGFGGGSGALGGGLGPAGAGGFGGAVPGGTALGGSDGLGAAGGGLGAGGGLPGGESGLAGGAGVAGAAGRGMPMMPPMAGAGAGRERGERQRAAWLTEDEDVWGAGDDGGDAVL